MQKANETLSNLTVWPKKYCEVWQLGRAMCASHRGVRNAARPGSARRAQLLNCTQSRETSALERRRRR